MIDVNLQPQPLGNIRVLELGAYIAAPYAASLLCALGSDVVKVERPLGGDDFRRQLDDKSPYFVQYNAGKRSLAVDLKHPEGVALVRSLLPHFDVVIENFRPGKLESLGLGPADCARLRPDIVYASVSGFGSGGPLREHAAYDTIAQGYGALYSVLGDADDPQLSGTCLADLISGLTIAAGVLAALVARAASGQGQHVETSLMEAVSTLTVDAITQYFANGRQDPSRQSRHPQAQNFCLRTASGEDIVIHLSGSEKFWLSLLTAVDRLDLTEDPRFLTYGLRQQHYVELVAIMEAEFVKRPAPEWRRRLTEADVPFAPVLTISDYLGHPQTQWLDLVEPERDSVALLRPPWRFDGVRPPRAAVAPRLGQHSREIASEVLDEQRVEELIASGVLFAVDDGSAPDRPERHSRQPVGQ